MEKQIKVIICADDGEWSRENTDALASRGAQVVTVNRNRSEERRVGKECRSRWSPYH